MVIIICIFRRLLGAFQFIFNAQKFILDNLIFIINVINLFLLILLVLVVLFKKFVFLLMLVNLVQFVFFDKLIFSEKIKLSTVVSNFNSSISAYKAERVYIINPSQDQKHPYVTPKACLCLTVSIKTNVWCILYVHCELSVKF